MNYFPFENNGRWKQLFRLQSQMSECGVTEVVELYKKNPVQNEVQEWGLFRFRFQNNSFPLRIVHKFTSLISGEYKERNGEYTLSLNTLYKENVVNQSFDACCGTKLWVGQVEKAIYEQLI